MKKALAGLVACAAAAALAPAVASAATPAPATCTGSLQNRIVGDLSIPYGTDCALRNVIVLGNLVADPNAGNISLDQTVVRGGAEFVTPASISVDTSVITGRLLLIQSYGDVTFTRSTFGEDASVIATFGNLRIGSVAANQQGNIFGGSLLVDRSFGSTTVERSIVAGNLSITNNEADVNVARNAIRGNLDCSDNLVEPTGGRNAAAAKLGQCAAL